MHATVRRKLFSGSLLFEEEMEREKAFYSDLFWYKVNWHGQRIWMPPIGEWKRDDWEELLNSGVPMRSECSVLSARGRASLHISVLRL
jgi:hypothetical protein